MENENTCPVAEQVLEDEVEPQDYTIAPDGSLVEATELPASV